MLASIESQRRIMVHIVSGFLGTALPLATHSLAWQGVAGAQSASVEQGSWLTTGLHSEQPQIEKRFPASFSGSREAGSAPGAEASIDGAAVGAPVAAATGAGVVVHAECARSSVARTAVSGTMCMGAS